MPNDAHTPSKNGREHHIFIKSADTVKPVLSSHSKRIPKIVFQDHLLLNAGQKNCRMLQESILQYFQPSLELPFVVKTLFCLFSSGRLRQVLLYKKGSRVNFYQRNVRLPGDLRCFSHYFSLS